MNTEEKPKLDETKEELKPDNEILGNDGIIDRSVVFIKKHLIVTILALALIITIIWSTAKNKASTDQADNRETELILKHETERYAMQINNLEFVSIMFSWAVRSELLRNNKENLNQLLTIFIQK